MNEQWILFGIMLAFAILIWVISASKKGGVVVKDPPSTSKSNIKPPPLKIKSTDLNVNITYSSKPKKARGGRIE